MAITPHPAPQWRNGSEFGRSGPSGSSVSQYRIFPKRTPLLLLRPRRAPAIPFVKRQAGRILPQMDRPSTVFSSRPRGLAEVRAPPTACASPQYAPADLRRNPTRCADVLGIGDPATPSDRPPRNAFKFWCALQTILFTVAVASRRSVGPRASSHISRAVDSPSVDALLRRPPGLGAHPDTRPLANRPPDTLGRASVSRLLYL